MSEDRQAQLREQVSALLDGELSEQELPMLMKRLELDSELRRYWRRQSQARDAMRGTAVSEVGEGFSVSVMSAIEDADGPGYPVDTDTDMPPVAHQPRVAHGWLKPVAGFAVAASVAGLAVLGLNTLELGGSGDAGQVAFFESASQSSLAGRSGPVWLDQTRVEPFPHEFSLAARNAGSSSVTNVDFKASRDRRLNSYLNQHEDQVWLLGVPGDPAPQARGYGSSASAKNIFDSYSSRPMMLGTHELAAE